MFGIQSCCRVFGWSHLCFSTWFLERTVITAAAANYEIHANIQDKLCSDIFYLDFRKAFDPVSHSILWAKLQLMGITGLLLNWLRVYLNSRLQLVSVNGHVGLLLVTSGVPQGSILDPLMFLVYINDLLGYVQFSRPLLFADDTHQVFKLYLCWPIPLSPAWLKLFISVERC